MENLFDVEALRANKSAQARVRKWIKALRSGEYEQANGTLRDGFGRYCCLGIACQLVDPRWGVLLRGSAYPNGHRLALMDSHSKPEFYLGPKGLRLFALTTKPLSIDDVNGGNGAYYLARLNDNGLTFAEIADVIEAHFNAALATTAA